MTPEQIKAHITPLLLSRLDGDLGRRGEALRDFMALSFPSLDPAAAERLSEIVPELPRELYEKWIGMFVERLLETIPQKQLRELCDGSRENNATLAMVYLLFMESERMEKQVAADLTRLSKPSAPASNPVDTAEAGETARMEEAARLDALAMYLKAKLRPTGGN